MLGNINPAQSLVGDVATPNYKVIAGDGLSIDGAGTNSFPSLIVRDYTGSGYSNLCFLGDATNQGKLKLFSPGQSTLHPASMLGIDPVAHIGLLELRDLVNSPTVPSVYIGALGYSYFGRDSSVNIRVGILTTSPATALHVNGTITHAGLNQLSDSTMKQIIQSLNPTWSVNKLKQLRPVSYEWIYKSDTAMYGTKYGFIAQQVETVIPELIKTDSSGSKSMDYLGVIAILTKSIQEQQKFIDTLRQEMTSMQAQLNSCCSSQSSTKYGQNDSGKGTTHSIDVELGSNTIVLNQNAPNPFAEKTSISYFIPDDIKFAQILFYDKMGRIIRTVDIEERGAGVLNVFAETLSTGTYSYSLIIDGKAFETKQMVKTK